jgi:hypothetical protein
MKRTLLLTTLIWISTLGFSQTYNPAISSYVTFLGKQNVSAKEYVFDLFKKYDIVILCERDHTETTQYKLILDILGDKRFTENINNAYFEIGNAAYNETLNRLIQNPSLSSKEISQAVMSMQRNIFPIPFEKVVYSYLLNGVYSINKKQPNEKMIHIYGLDESVMWETATKEDIHSIISHVSERDSLLADNFIKSYKNNKTKKALVVLNYRHAFLHDLPKQNAGRFIAEEFKGQVASVYINSYALISLKVTDSNVPQIAIGTPQKGKWEAAFIKANKIDLGFDFKGTPFGKDSFDLMPVSNKFSYSDMFTGFIYYNHFENLHRSMGLKNFIDKQFTPELTRRLEIQQEYMKVLYRKELTLDDLWNVNKIHNNFYRKEYPDAIKGIEQWLKTK